MTPALPQALGHSLTIRATADHEGARSGQHQDSACGKRTRKEQVPVRRTPAGSGADAASRASRVTTTRSVRAVLSSKDRRRKGENKNQDAREDGSVPS